jgi:glycine cleavage system transcriptional repressor
MLMVQTGATGDVLDKTLRPVADELSLHFHVDKIEGKLHDHREPDVRISVYGADRIGIVAQVTGKLATAGLDIFDLESDVAGTDDKPVYIMHIEGRAEKGPDALKAALLDLADQGIQAHLQTIDTVIG